MIQRTFSVVKPDATERNLTGAINARIEAAGLRIVAQKRILLTRRMVEKLYAAHAGRDYFDGQCEYMMSGPVVVQVLEGDDAIARYRALMGPTDREKAPAGTLRHEFAQTYRRNSVHGSDSPESATQEIGLFFSESEIVG